MLFRGLSENSTPINSIVDYFAYCGSIGVHIHAITRTQVTENAFRGDLQSYAAQFRVTSSLNVVNSQNPLV
jgi:hypothetical protein